jgi:hypothetical protein
MCRENGPARLMAVFEAQDAWTHEQAGILQFRTALLAKYTISESLTCTGRKDLGASDLDTTTDSGSEQSQLMSLGVHCGLQTWSPTARAPEMTPQSTVGHV